MAQVNDEGPKLSKKESKIRRVWSCLDFWLGPVKPVFDMVVITVMVLSLLSAYKSLEVARNANKLTRQALRSSYVPWLKLTGFSIDRKNNDIVNLSFRLKNFSPTAPAIGLTTRSLNPKILNEQWSYKQDALMPAEEGHLLLTFNIKTSADQATIHAIQTGELPVRISVSCSDIFGTPYTIEQEFRKIGSEYRIIEYLPKGVASGID
jgi:hypothetical protein